MGSMSRIIAGRPGVVIDLVASFLPAAEVVDVEPLVAPWDSLAAIAIRGAASFFDALAAVDHGVTDGLLAARRQAPIISFLADDHISWWPGLRSLMGKPVASAVFRGSDTRGSTDSGK